MGLVSVKVKPGVDVESTPTLNEAGWAVSNLVRFKDGMVQKLGGWARFYSGTIGSPIRHMHSWQDLSGVSHLALGATTSLNVVTSGSAQVITPQTITNNPAVAFSTTNGSPTVTITDASSNAGQFDVVQIRTQVSVGGIVLYGVYPVAGVISSTQFTITAASNATAPVTAGGAVPSYATTVNTPNVSVTLANHGLTVGSSFAVAVPTTVGGLTLSGLYTVAIVTSSSVFVINAANSATSTASASENAGNVRLTYYIAVGAPSVGSGWGSIGGWGGGGWGQGQTGSPRTGTAISATDWTFDNAGDTLLSCPAGGPIYAWSPLGGFTTANILANAPPANSGIFLSMPQQILVAYGAATLGIQDPLLVRWSDVSNFNLWIAASGNQAGSYRLPTGSYIVGGIQGPQQGLIWTDVGVWAMQYIGYPGVFGFNEIAKGCGLMAKHAAGVLGSDVFWLSQTQFFVMSGGSSPQPVPCTVWDFLFQNLNTAYTGNIRCAVNSRFNEVTWYFPSTASVSGENDAYVKLTRTPNGILWDYGYLARSAWIDQGVLGPPIGATATGIVYQHEVANDADGAALNAYIQTGYFMIAEGTQFTFVDWMLPDFKFGFNGQPQNATLLVTLYAADYPSATPRTYGPFTITAASTFISQRIRGRQLAMRVESQDIGTWWRLGNLRYRGAADGRR